MAYQNATTRTSPAPLVAVVILGIAFLVFFSLPFLHGFIVNTTGYGLATNREAPDFHLKSPEGSMASLANYQGKFVFLMFGYLNCEDICHSQALLFQEINQMADIPDETQFLYVSMDPERDSVAQLMAYFDDRGNNFTSLRSEDMKTVQMLAGNYRAYFATNGKTPAGDYEISHPGLFFLIGPDSRLRFIYPANKTNTRQIVSDLTGLRKEYN